MFLFVFCEFIALSFPYLHEICVKKKMTGTFFAVPETLLSLSSTSLHQLHYNLMNLFHSQFSAAWSAWVWLEVFHYVKINFFYSFLHSHVSNFKDIHLFLPHDLELYTSISESKSSLKTEHFVQLTV